MLKLLRNCYKYGSKWIYELKRAIRWKLEKVRGYNL